MKGSMKYQRFMEFERADPLSEYNLRLGLEMRTKQGVEIYCLRYIDRMPENTISHFWATENRMRASAMQRLVDQAIIIAHNLDYPYTQFTITPARRRALEG